MVSRRGLRWAHTTDRMASAARDGPKRAYMTPSRPALGSYD